MNVTASTGRQEPVQAVWPETSHRPAIQLVRYVSQEEFRQAKPHLDWNNPEIANLFTFPFYYEYKTLSTEEFKSLEHLVSKHPPDISMRLK